MGRPADGSGHRRANRGPADPEQRRPRSPGRLVAIAVGVVVVVLVVWLVVYLAARQQAEAGGGAAGQGIDAVASGSATTERARTLAHLAGPGACERLRWDRR